MDLPMWPDQQIFAFISSVQTLNAVMTTRQDQWSKGTDGESQSFEINNDDDDDT